MSRLFDKYIFYADFHKNKWNKLVHYFCIPALAWTLFIFCNYIPFSFSPIQTKLLLPICNNCVLSFRPSIILLLLYHVYYLYLHLVVGFFSLIFYSILWYTSNIFYCQIDYAWIWAIGIHVFSWILQIAGHRICEGNQPAFITGAVQSFLMAPIFVVYDWCMYVGIVDRPEYLDHINNKNKRRNSDNDIDSDSDIIDYSSLME